MRDPAGMISRNLTYLECTTHLSLPVDGGRRVSGGGAVEADGGALARRDAAVARHRMNPRGDCKKGEGGRKGAELFTTNAHFQLLGSARIIRFGGWLTGWFAVGVGGSLLSTQKPSSLRVVKKGENHRDVYLPNTKKQYTRSVLTARMNLTPFPGSLLRSTGLH